MNNIIITHKATFSMPNTLYKIYKFLKIILNNSSGYVFQIRFQIFRESISKFNLKRHLNLINFKIRHFCI